MINTFLVFFLTILVTYVTIVFGGYKVKTGGASMNGTKLKQLSRMKELITLGKRRFQNRPDRDYLSDLVELGISEEEVWNYILLLNKIFIFTILCPVIIILKHSHLKEK